MIAGLSALVSVERVAVSDTKNIMKVKRAIEKALKAQKEKKGFRFIEILSGCPTGWKMCPVDGIKYINEVLVPHCLLGVYKDEINQCSAKICNAFHPSPETITQILQINRQSPVFLAEVAIDKSQFPLQKLRIVGHGGQGILLMGTALLAMEMGLEVTWPPSYGPGLVSFEPLLTVGGL